MQDELFYHQLFDLSGVRFNEGLIVVLLEKLQHELKVRNVKYYSSSTIKTDIRVSSIKKPLRVILLWWFGHTN